MVFPSSIDLHRRPDCHEAIGSHRLPLCPSPSCAAWSPSGAPWHLLDLRPRPPSPSSAYTPGLLTAAGVPNIRWSFGQLLPLYPRLPSGVKASCATCGTTLPHGRGITWPFGFPRHARGGKGGPRTESREELGGAHAAGRTAARHCSCPGVSQSLLPTRWQGGSVRVTEWTGQEELWWEEGNPGG